MTEREALKLALDALETSMYPQQKQLQAITAIKKALAQPEQEPVAFINVEQRKLEWAKYMTWDTPTVVNLPKIPLYTTPPQRKEPEQEPVAWKYDVTYNQDGTVSVALPDGDELRIVLPNQQEPYCWTWDVWVSGGKWRAEYGWEKPTEKVVNLQPLYTSPPQRKPLTEQEIGAILEGVNAYGTRLYTFARAIEAAHGIKGEV